ncbi:MAG: hypothetical protein SVU94_05020 [Bacteroidota bacterium]|nr:hypothetical protein [Bacteroidota bacterium]
MEASQGKSFFLRPIPDASTEKKIVGYGLYKDVLAYPLNSAYYAFPVRQYSR